MRARILMTAFGLEICPTIFTYEVMIFVLFSFSPKTTLSLSSTHSTLSTKTPGEIQSTVYLCFFSLSRISGHNGASQRNGVGSRREDMVYRRGRMGFVYYFTGFCRFAYLLLAFKEPSKPRRSGLRSVNGWMGKGRCSLFSGS